MKRLWVWLNTNGYGYLILAGIWVALIPFALLVWKDSILFVIIMSLYANIAASLAAREGAQDQDFIELDHERIAEIKESVAELTKMVERLAGAEEVDATRYPEGGKHV